MKNVINGTDYIKATSVMAWLTEAREIIEEYPVIGIERLRIEHSFTREGYKVSYIPVNDLLKRIEKYPHTSFTYRPELIKLLHRIAENIDRWLEYKAKCTVEVIRLSDGEHLMVTEEIAKEVVETLKVAQYA